MKFDRISILPSLPPVLLLYFAGLFYLAVLGSSLWLMTNQTYLGIRFDPERAGKIIKIAADTHWLAANRPEVGNTVLAISNGQRSVGLTQLSFLQEPDNLTNYGDYNRFFSHLAELNKLFLADRLILQLDNGESVTVSPQDSRPISDLPFEYWLIQCFSGLGFFIGVWIWGFRRGQKTSRLLVIGGFSFMMAASTMATYAYRELAFDAEQFRVLSEINHLNNSSLAYSLVILLCIYPGRLFNLPVFLIGFGVCIIVWLNELFQLFEIPFHSFYLLQFFLPAVLGIVFGRLQWLKHKKDPVARASIRWLSLTLFLSVGLVIILYFGPTFFNEPPLLSLWVAQLVLLGLYGGFVLGVLQYRLFQVERWWLVCWVWFFAGLFVSFIDVALIYLFNIHPLNSLSVSILLTAWLYFPLRHWIWQRAISGSQTCLEEFYPLLLESYISSGSVDRFIQSWPDVLKKIYLPISIEERPGVLSDVSIPDQGYTICIPDVADHEKCWVLSGMDKGSKLFTQQEVNFIHNAIRFSRNCIEWGKSREEISRQERERLTRDLHDDVGALLLSLIHKAESAENSRLARAALKGVRETIYSLRNEQTESFRTALATWRQEILERLSEADVVLEWYADTRETDFDLNARQRINLDRILREAVTNILKHARPRHVSVFTRQFNGKVEIIIIDDGIVSDPEQWQPHTGLFNLRTRAEEIGASLNWTVRKTEPAKTEFTISFPVSMPW